MTKIDKNHVFILCEIMKVDLDKWIEGCNINKDPGNEYVLDWVSDNAAKYRDQWESSKCSTCCNWRRCGWKALMECNEYKPE